MSGAEFALSLPAMIIMAISGIQPNWELPVWFVILPVAFFLMPIIGAGFVVGSVIAAFTPGAPIWKGALVGIGVAIGAAMIVGVAISIAWRLPPALIAIHYVGYIGLAAIALYGVFVAIRRIGRNAATSD